MSLILRRDKGSKLTITELDNNFEYLDNKSASTGDIIFTGLTMSSQILDKDVVLETKGEGGFVIQNDNNKSWVLNLGIKFNDNSDVYGSSVTTDDLGNTYTTGGDYDSDRGFIIKTNHVGEVIWQKTITQYSFGESIVYKNGKLFVLLTESGNGDGILILKLDTDGNSLGQWSFQSSGGASALGYEIDVDDDENVYWTGSYYDSHVGNADIVVGKLNTVSNTIDWAYLIDGPASAYDYGYSIKYKSGFIYISSRTDDFEFGSPIGVIRGSILTIKLDVDGTKIWDNITAITEGYQGGTSITIDNDNNVYVVGDKSSERDNIGNFFLKLNSSGNLVWLKSLGFNGSISSIDFNEIDGHLYITGNYNPSHSSNDILISKVSTAGEVIWQNIVGTDLDDEIWYNNGHRSIKVTDGQIYLTGYTYVGDTTNSNMFLLSYNKDGMLPKTYGDWTVLAASFSFATPVDQLVSGEFTYGLTSSTGDFSSFTTFEQTFIKPSFKIIDSKAFNHGGTYSTVSYDTELTSFNPKKTQLKVKGEINVNDLYVMPESQGKSGEVLSYPETGNVLQWGKPGTVIATDDFITPSTINAENTSFGETGNLTQLVGQYETTIVTLTNWDIADGVGGSYTIHRRNNDYNIISDTFNYDETPNVTWSQSFGVEQIYSDNYKKQYKITLNDYSSDENAVITIETTGGLSASIVTNQGYSQQYGFDDDFVEIDLKDYPYYPYNPATVEIVDGKPIFKKGFDSTVYKTYIQSDGKILVGGAFGNYGAYVNSDISSNRIIRLNSDGTNDKSFNIGSGFDGKQVFTIKQQSDGKILVGGQFDTYQGITQSNISRLNLDGSLDTTFNTGTGFDNGTKNVRTIEIQPNDKILVGGELYGYNGTSVSRIIRLNSNGTIDTTFDTGTGFNGEVISIKYLSNDKILVGGGFSDYNGNSTNGLILLNTDGTVDTTFTVNNTVLVIEEQSDGRILIGGDFTSFNGYSVGRFVRLLPYSYWNLIDTIDFNFNLGNNTNFDGAVYTIKQQSDGKILVGGSFTQYYNPSKGEWVSVPYLARLNSNGEIDDNFDTNTLAINSTVKTISIQSDDKIIVGGEFTNFDSRCIIRLYSGLEPEYITPKFLGVSYDKIGVSSNSYLTFGGGSSQLSLGDSNPNLPGIFISADDRSYQRVWVGIQGSRREHFLKIRYEGGTDTEWNMDNSPQIIWEISLFDEKEYDLPTIDVKIGTNDAYGTGFSAIKGSDYSLKYFKSIPDSSFILPEGWGLKETKYETIKFNPGTTVQYSEHTKVSEVKLPVAAADYQMNNGNVWGIRTYNGRTEVQLSSSSWVTWFDFSAIPGYVYSNLRGGIIEYHAFLSGNCNGTIIGSITFAIDTEYQNPVHTQHFSGDGQIENIILWGKNNIYGNPGSFQAQDTTGGTTNLMIQWTSRLFFGDDCWC